MGWLWLCGIAGAQSFSYADFSSNSLAANPLQLNGNAAAPVTGLGGTAVLRLTTATTNQKSSVFALNSVDLGANASFSTAFSFQISNSGGTGSDGDQPPEPIGADGIVFVLTTAGNDVGATGAGVGFEGITNSLGIKFDMYRDGGSKFPQYSDPNGNFVAVYTNGVADTTGYVPYATANARTKRQYYTPPTYMKNGDVWYAWIDYNGATGELDLRLTDGTNARPATPQLIQTFFLTSSTSLGSSPHVFAGFTSGTGSQYQDQDILTWQFFDDFNPVGIPRLSLQNTNGGIVLSWPAPAGNFYLQQNPNPAVIGWTSNSIAPVMTNGNNQVIITPAGGNMFYRLISQ